MTNIEEIKELMEIIRYKINLLNDTDYYESANNIGNKLGWHLDDMYEYLYEYDDPYNDMFCNGEITDDCNGGYCNLQTIIRLRDTFTKLADNYNDELYNCLIEDNKNLDRDLVKLDIEKSKKKNITSIKVNKKPAKGSVYIIKVNDYYKIGKTKNIEKRIGEYTRLMEEPKIIICEEVDNYSLIEKELHKMFEDKNTRGEWFSLSEEDISIAIDFINNNKLK